MIDIIRTNHLYYKQLIRIYKSDILINITLRQLACFREVARTRSFTDAASRLHTSQSSLSTAVRDLENLIDARLIERTTKHFELTAIGAEFLAAVTQVLDDLQRALADVSSATRLQTGVLTVGASPLLAGSLLADLVGRFRVQYPGLDIRLRDSAANILNLLRTREIELALGTFDEANRDFIIKPLFDDPLVVLAHPSLNLPSPCSWRTLLKLPLISIALSGGVGQLIQKTVWRVTQRDFNPLVQVENWTTVVSLTNSFKAACVIPHYGAQHITAMTPGHELVQLKLVRPEVERPISVAYSSLYHLSPVARAFLALLTSTSWLERVKPRL